MIQAKIITWVLIFVVGSVSGIAVQQKFLTKETKPCPACNCPEPTVSVQPFDVEKIKGVKSFNYAPQFTGNVSVAGVKDSASLQLMIDRSIDAAFEKHVGKKIRR